MCAGVAMCTDVRPLGGHHRFDVVIVARDVETHGSLHRQIAVPVTCGDDLHRVDFAKLLQMRVGNLPASHDCNAQRLAGGISSKLKPSP